MQKRPALYLKKLFLKNFAIFSEQEVTFSHNFNAIIGETGSGKSLILEALLMGLGGRSDKKFIRPDTQFCQIEIIFTVNDRSIESFFHNLGYPIEGDEVIIKRIIYRDRPSKCFLNFSQCSITDLENFTHTFIDFVGQFDNQKILKSSYQLSLIDHYGNAFDLLRSYQEAFQKFQAQSELIEKLKIASKNKEEKLNFLKYQLEEIEKLSPSQEDEDNLIHQKNNFKKIEKIKEFSHKILGPLSENEDFNVIGLFKKIVKTIENNSTLLGDPLQRKALDLFEQLNDFSYQVSQELAYEDIDLNINNIMAKIFLYQKLKAKYGLSSNELAQKHQDLVEEINEIEKIEDKLENEQKNSEIIYNELMEIGQKLHQKRVKFSRLLEKNLTEKIHALNMPEATLKISLSYLNTPNEFGITDLKFEAETNKNYGFHLIKEIASGGELSRILLAIRHELAAKETIQIFLFDEIDTGLGGTTALKIGKVLSEIAQNSQVMAITHLPQIAHCSDKLILVSKNSAEHSSDFKSIGLIQEVVGKEKSKQIKSMTPLH